MGSRTCCESVIPLWCRAMPRVTWWLSGLCSENEALALAEGRPPDLRRPLFAHPASHSRSSRLWGSPDFAHTDQVFMGVSVGATMHRCS